MKECSAFDAFERMERKVDETEARADAIAEIAADSGDTKLEDEFAELQMKDSLDDDLAALKTKVAKGTESDDEKSEA